MFRRPRSWRIISKLKKRLWGLSTKPNANALKNKKIWQIKKNRNFWTNSERKKKAKKMLLVNRANCYLNLKKWKTNFYRVQVKWKKQWHRKKNLPKPNRKLTKKWKRNRNWQIKCFRRKIWLRIWNSSIQVKKKRSRTRPRKSSNFGPGSNPWSTKIRNSMKSTWKK